MLKKFIKRLKQFPIKNNITYSIVGFGSKKYPDYCKYAIKLDSLLQKNDFSNCNTPIHLVNKQSQKEFELKKFIILFSILCMDNFLFCHFFTSTLLFEKLYNKDCRILVCICYEACKLGFIN